MKKIKQSNLRKGLIALIFDNGKSVIIGQGTWEGKKIGGQAVFVATLVKEIPKRSPKKKISK